MKTCAKILGTILLLASYSFARGVLSGNCEQGGQRLTILGAQSSTYVQASYPACTVTVYVVGSGTPTTIYVDNSGTPLSNPFVANLDGSYYFYADDGNYQINLSGLPILTPYNRYGTISGGISASVSTTPTANFIPQAYNTGLIDIGWLSRTGSGSKVFTAGAGSFLNGQGACFDSASNIVSCGFTPGAGTVTNLSVGNLSSLFTTSVGSPTSTPAITFNPSNFNANYVLAGPVSGGAGAYSARALVSLDIPNNAANTTGNAATATALATLPTPCSSGNAPTGILANGNSTGCQPVGGGGISGVLQPLVATLISGVITIACSSGSPCGATIDGTTYTYTSNMTCSAPSGSPTARIYVSNGSTDSAQGGVAGHVSIRSTLTSANPISCTGIDAPQYSQSSFPPSAIPIASVTATTPGTWDTPTNLSSIQSSNSPPIPGTGCTTFTGTPPTINCPGTGGSSNPQLLLSEGPQSASCPSTDTALPGGTYVIPGGFTIGIGDFIEVHVAVGKTGTATSPTPDIAINGTAMDDHGGFGYIITMNAAATPPYFSSFDGKISVVSSTEAILNVRQAAKYGAGTISSQGFDATGLSTITGNPTITVTGANCGSGDTMFIQHMEVWYGKAVHL